MSDRFGPNTKQIEAVLARVKTLTADASILIIQPRERNTMMDEHPLESKPISRILVTGSRDWSNKEAVIAVLRRFHSACPEAVLVHGGCPTGADALCGEVWEDFGGVVEVHPADWSLGRKAGPLRNQQMVDLGADICIAFPLPNSRGTKDCMARAEKGGIPVVVVNIIGEVVE